MAGRAECQGSVVSTQQLSIDLTWPDLSQILRWENITSLSEYYIRAGRWRDWPMFDTSPGPHWPGWQHFTPRVGPGQWEPGEVSTFTPHTGHRCGRDYKYNAMGRHLLSYHAVPVLVIQRNCIISVSYVSNSLLIREMYNCKTNYICFCINLDQVAILNLISRFSPL